MHNFMGLGLVGKAIASIIALAVIGVGVVYLYKPVSQVPGVVDCTAEAMQCPDGSYVGRSGPNCQFVCPSSTSTSATTTPPANGGGGNSILPYNSGISGTVSTGPTCPVERMPPDPECADKPYSTTVSVSRANNPGTPFATTKSDATGAFKLSLPPGNYVVGAGQSNLPRCPQTPATVEATGYTNVTVVCDSGIR